ncbi:DEAD/DEAH box helicase [Leucobacter sp. HY1910]
MAKGRRGGFKPPANYEPGRNPRKKTTRYEVQASKPDADRAPREKRETREPRVTRENRNQQKAVLERQREQHRAPLPEAVRTTVADAAQATFASLGLGGNLVRVLGELGAESPFPVQVATIPDAIAGRNVLGRANTGSGKTIAFGAALVERMLKLKAEGHIARAPKKSAGKRGVRTEGPRPQAVRHPKALILAPTRELALQIDRTVQPLARSVGFYTAQLVGGTPIDAQVHALERGVDIVIGTPGRIQDLVDRRRLDLREVLVSVIDEADHMCELGFLEPVQKVLRQTVNGGQRLLFSATLDADVSDLVAEFLPEPVVHEAEEKAPGRVDHSVLLVRGTERDAVITQLAKRRGRTMVFCRTRANAERITQMLGDDGVRAVELHGNLSQARRELNLERFSDGKVAVLVATDVAARGIHVDGVDLVVQADPPSDYKTYLHRTGRTGRAGSDGRAVLLISRARQERTEAMLAEAGVKPRFFGDFAPGDKLR